MEQTHAQLNPGQVIAIDRSSRWQIRHRLQELDIVCECLADGRLRVLADTPAALIQLRSVLQQWSLSSQALADQLERCWQQSS